MKIGNLELGGNVFLAPMAGITDPPFRRVVQRFGVSALWTEMISAHGMVTAASRFRTVRLDGHLVPTIFQISAILGSKKYLRTGCFRWMPIMF